MEELVGREDFDLVGISRREVPLPEGARMQMRLGPVEVWPDILNTIRPDVLVCALGTTWNKSGHDEEALRAAGKEYTMYMYPGVNHGFHNDTTPRYDREAAQLAQQRTMAFFNQHLR